MVTKQGKWIEASFVTGKSCFAAFLFPEPWQTAHTKPPYVPVPLHIPHTVMVDGESRRLVLNVVGCAVFEQQTGFALAFLWDKSEG